MDLDTPIEPNCIVSGALSFILHVSRLAGIAPLSFEKVRGGWRISFSWIFFIYTIVVTSLLQIFAGILTFDTREEFSDGYEPASNTQFMKIITNVILVTQVIECFFITLSGWHRHRIIIHSVVYLEQMNKSFNSLFRTTYNDELKTWVKVIILLIYGYIGAFTDFGVYIYDVQAANDTVPLKSLYFLAVYFNICQLQLFTIQFNLIVTRLVSTLRRLNKYLKNWLEELRNDALVASTWQNDDPNDANDCDVHIDIIHLKYFSPRNPCVKIKNGSKINSDTLRQLIKIYCSLCNMVKLLNGSHGLSLIMLLLYVTAFMVTAPYFVVTIMFRTQSEMPLFKIISIVLWCSLCFVLLLSLTEPCHLTHLELKLTKRLINQLLRFTPREQSDVYWQLKFFKRHILLNPVSFSPMHILKFDRNLSVAVLSAVITYLSLVTSL